MTSAFKKSPLCDLMTRHTSFDFNDFVATTAPEDYDHWNGYCLPVAYGDAAEEYDAIRKSCAIFDASPMKKYRFRGSDAGRFLDYILTAPVSNMPAMRASYGLLCNEDGLLYDDGILLKFSNEDYLLLITEIDLEPHFDKYNDFANLAISEETSSLVGIAVQGPQSCAVLEAFGFSNVEKLKPFDIKYYEISGHTIVLGRLGFTGDLGYELWFAPEATESVNAELEQAESALDLKILGYGLSAVQICRIEAAMVVPGWDTTGEFSDTEKERTPFELNLGWNVKLKREDDFVGKQALIQHKADGPRFQMKGFRISDPCTIEDGQRLFARINGELVDVGLLPSVIWHTAKDHWIGFASLKTAFSDVGGLYITDNGSQVACELCNLPFIDLERRIKVPADISR